MGTMQTMDTTKRQVEKKAGDVVALLVRGVEAAAGLGSLIRYFDGRSMPSWMPFQRRRSVWGAIGLFGAGIAVGAGVSMLMAPMSGQDARQGLWRGLRDAGRKGKELLENAEQEVADLAKGEEGGQKQQATGQRGNEPGGRSENKGDQPGGRSENKGEHRPGNATGTMGSPGRMG